MRAIRLLESARAADAENLGEILSVILTRRKIACRSTRFPSPCPRPLQQLQGRFPHGIL